MGRWAREDEKIWGWGPGAGWRLHLLGFWILLLNPVGHGAVALVEAFHTVGFEVDAASDVFYVLHVCPAGNSASTGVTT